MNEHTTTKPAGFRDGGRAIFTSTDSEYRHESGTRVEIVRQLDDTEVDDDVGRMYSVRRSDGSQFHAFEDELKPEAA